MIFLTRTILSIMICAILVACMGPKGYTVDEKRQFIDRMRSETLERLYRSNPEAESRMQIMAGSAVFSSINTNLLLFSTASGYGVAVDRQDGRKTYMKMYQFGLGPGLGIKDYRLVIMFRTREALNYFVEEGWEFGGTADAAAKSGEEKGGAVSGQATLDSDLVIYTLTEAGLALQATVEGTRYWVDSELN